MTVAAIVGALPRRLEGEKMSLRAFLVVVLLASLVALLIFPGAAAAR